MFSLTNSVHSHSESFSFFIISLEILMDHTTPGIPVGFTAIFIMFSTLRHELSEMLKVVVICKKTKKNKDDTFI